tara:strand:- start:175 stop:519 length:345 start_codon:yes stop_codon:yes gene_type:complete
MKRSSTNVINLNIEIDQTTNTNTIDVEYNFSVTMPSEQKLYYQDIISGLISKLNTEMDTFAKEGLQIRTIEELRNFVDNDEAFIIFEPDEELLEKVSDTKNGTKVLPFNNKKLH